MTTPREDARPEAGATLGASVVPAAGQRAPRSGDQGKAAVDDAGGSRIADAVDKGRGFWEWIQRTRPWRAFSHFTDVGGSVLSGGMSYQALFAVFAGLWVGFGILGISLRGRTELLDSLVDQLNTLVPGLVGNAHTSGAVQLDTLLQARALDWTSIIAGAALLWVALNWFTGTRRSIRLIFELEVKQYRNALLLKLRDFVLALCFSVAVLMSAALTVMSSNFADMLLGWLGASSSNWLFSTLGMLVRYGALLIFDVIMLLAMHRFLAEVRIPWWPMLRGCVLGAGVLLVLKILGVALLGGATRNPLLASFAVLVGLLIWFNLICRALLLTSSWIATGLDRTLGLPEELAPDETPESLLQGSVDGMAGKPHSARL